MRQKEQHRALSIAVEPTSVFMCYVSFGVLCAVFAVRRSPFAVCVLPSFGNIFIRIYTYAFNSQLHWIDDIHWTCHRMYHISNTCNIHTNERTLSATNARLSMISENCQKHFYVVKMDITARMKVEKLAHTQRSRAVGVWYAVKLELENKCALYIFIFTFRYIYIYML